MPTYTSTLPANLLQNLKQASKELKMPKNKIIEKAVSLYLEQYKRALYIQSFKRASSDQELLDIAEEGMSDYLKGVNLWDETN